MNLDIPIAKHLRFSDTRHFYNVSGGSRRQVNPRGVLSKDEIKQFNQFSPDVSTGSHDKKFHVRIPHRYRNKKLNKKLSETWPIIKQNGLISRHPDLESIEHLTNNGVSLESDCSDNPDARVVFNIGGRVFHVKWSLLHQPDRTIGMLTNLNEMRLHWHNGQCAYFFDRDPCVFEYVLLYLKTGHLHIPQYLCGPRIGGELQFWGVSLYNVSSCCWIGYCQSMETYETFCVIEKDRNPAYMRNTKAYTMLVQDWWSELRANIWNKLNEPFNSKIGKLYVVTCISMILLDVSVYCLQTFKPDVLPVNSTKTETVFGINAHTYFTTLTTLQLSNLTYFLMEFVLFLLVAPDRKEFLKSREAIIHMVALLPEVFYFAFVDIRNDISLTIINILSYERAFRLVRILNHIDDLWVIIFLILQNFKLMVFVFSTTASIGLLSAGALVHFEPDDGMVNVLENFYWSINTLTTVGDNSQNVPRSATGKFFTGIVATFGLIMMPITMAVVILHFNNTLICLKYISKKERNFIKIWMARKTSFTLRYAIPYTEKDMTVEEIFVDQRNRRPEVNVSWKSFKIDREEKIASISSQESLLSNAPSDFHLLPRPSIEGTECFEYSDNVHSDSSDTTTSRM